ncbi:unnamed protein product [Lymnaea stagnalis]|uniref:Gamma-butyrobetaine dioxygenase n=1 Tax=Lymnaea stagnalis TaxID=6523 RepID=A0AAV2H2V8_LYMST
MAGRLSVYQVAKIVRLNVLPGSSTQKGKKATSFFKNQKAATVSIPWPSSVIYGLHQAYSTVAEKPKLMENVTSACLHNSGKTCFVVWKDGFHTEFHSVWLRQNCHCEMCRHENGQRVLNPANIPTSSLMQNLFLEGTKLKVTWSGAYGNHEGYIPLSFLREHNYSQESILARRKAVKCEKTCSKIPTITFEEIKQSKDGLLKWLYQINEEGLSIVNGVPTEESMVQEVAELIGPVEVTIYGNTFDVLVTPDPINVAYSSVGLDLHMDLAYYESPPGLQLLHCLKFDACVEGGESTFLDAFALVDQFRINYPDLFKSLTEIPATFQKVHYKRDNPVHIVNQKPHIRLNHLGEVVAVYWATPFEGPLSVDENEVMRYYLAYEMFAKMIRDSPNLLQHRLQPGELVVFNNQRMLHGRQGFQINGGSRHLKGCYINIDIFKSKTQVYNNLFGDGRRAKRVGNQCWF